MIAEMNDEVLAELPKMIHEEGITSLKVFMAYKNVFQADDGTLYRTLLEAKRSWSTRHGTRRERGCD